ncbi:MAG: segregation and condensation protein A [Gammaproteobacteria bacterium]|nr:segregation and condensation protein A [Gammaproteobacteria bacterium]MDH5727586.1 segregation and condensation protein A [Gammaproteobacteria bacterium]
MADFPDNKELQILRMVKRVLTDVAKDTHVTPGLKHPLTEDTILGIRDCLALISKREAEISEKMGKPMSMRPRFVDEPKTSHSVKVESIFKNKRNDEDA